MLLRSPNIVREVKFLFAATEPLDINFALNDAVAYIWQASSIQVEIQEALFSLSPSQPLAYFIIENNNFKSKFGLDWPFMIIMFMFMNFHNLFFSFAAVIVIKSFFFSNVCISLVWRLSRMPAQKQNIFND